MRTLFKLAACVIVVACAFSARAQDATNLYVATNGNDAWSGTLDAPNAEGTDGPFATIAGARDAIRGIKSRDGILKPITVQIRGGVYRIAEPITFTPEDSGTDQAPIAYTAYSGEEPVVSGGILLTDWRQEGDIWVTQVPAPGPGPAPFSALWVNGVYRHRARTPNEGYFMTNGKVETIKDADDKEVQSPTNAFTFKPGDIKQWPDLNQAVAVTMHSWDTTHLPIARVDFDKNIAFVNRSGGWAFSYWAPEQRYYIENVREELDAPGEWYLDRDTGKVSYMPMEGEQPGNTEIVAPMVQRLVVFEGDVANGSFVEHVTIRGLKLHHTDYSLGPEGMNNQQAAVSVNAAVHAIGARHCVVEDCEVAHISNYAVWFGKGCQHNRIARNHLHDMGAGGVRFGETGEGENENEYVRYNVADNNWIHDGGKQWPAAVGAWIGRSSFNTVSHNEISDLFYTGVSVGWSWGYAPSTAHHNTIEYNHIHHIGQGILSDMGGIYCLGIAPGTVLRGNLIHDVFSYSYGGWGIYPDEGSSHLLITDNVSYNTKTGGFHQHYGKENHVLNNIFAFSHQGQVIRSREEEHISFVFQRNIVYFNNGETLGSNWSNNNYIMDFNCYWDTSEPDVYFAGMPLDEWQELGHDRHSIVADPMFVDAENFDFTLKPESPAFTLGFEPIDTSQAGLYGDAAWVNAPKAIERPPSELPEPVLPQPMADDFETTGVGEHAQLATYSGVTAEATIRVTDETAASGDHSLKFVDAPGLDQVWNPHIFYRPALRGDMLLGEFDVRMEPGAVLYHEWRGPGNPYSIGPTLTVDGEGNLSATHERRTTLPHAQWCHIAIECPLNKQHTGTYNLIVTVPGQDPRRFDGIPFGHDSFRRLNWVGFVANANAQAVFYIDNLSLQAKE